MKVPVCLIVLSLLTASCEKAGDLFRSYGPETTETRQIGYFTSINAGEKFDVILVQDSAKAGTAEVTAGKNVISGYTTKVTGDELRIVNENSFNWVRKLNVRQKVVVYFRKLEKIQISGSAKFTCRGKIKSEKEFRVDHGGLEDAEFDVEGDYIFVNATNTGGLVLTGSCYMLSASVDDISFIKSFDLDAEKCYLHSFSRENSYVYGKDVLDIKLYGAGNIYYRQLPSVNFSVEDSGEGSVLKY